MTTRAKIVSHDCVKDLLELVNFLSHENQQLKAALEESKDAKNQA